MMPSPTESKPMSELHAMVTTAFAQMQQEGAIEKMIREQIEKTTKGIISELLREYSDFGKVLKQGLSKALEINLADLHLPTYNAMILAEINQAFGAELAKSGVDQIRAAVARVLTPDLPAKGRLSKLLLEMRKEVLAPSEDDVMSLHIDESEVSGKPYYNIHMDPEGNKDKYGCKYGITVFNDRITRLTIDNKDYAKRLSLDFGRQELTPVLIAMYQQGTPFDVDVDEGCDEANALAGFED